MIKIENRKDGTFCEMQGNKYELLAEVTMILHALRQSKKISASEVMKAFLLSLKDEDFAGGFKQISEDKQ